MKPTSLPLLLLFCASTAAAQEAIPNPGRPTVSSPATLTPVGYLQFESGVTFDRHSPEFSHRLGTSAVVKLSLNSRLQSFVQIEPVVRSMAGDSRELHAGGVTAGLQAVLAPGHEGRPTIAVSYLRSLHEGPVPDIDVGSASQSAMLLVSGDFRRFHFDANGIASEQTGGNVRRGQFGETLAVSHSLRKITIAGEVWHFSQPLLNGHAAGTLWAVSYPLRGNLVIDAAVNHGLTKTSTRWETFAGFTYLLPRRLWR